jgi:hypothetical protein
MVLGKWVFHALLLDDNNYYLHNRRDRIQEIATAFCRYAVGLRS